MMNKARCGKSAGSKSKETNKNKSREGNPVSKLGDTHGMEYKQVKGTKVPKSGRLIDWDK